MPPFNNNPVTNKLYFTKEKFVHEEIVWFKWARARLTCKEVIHETPTYLTTNTLLSAGYSFHVTDLTVPFARAQTPTNLHTDTTVHETGYTSNWYTSNLLPPSEYK